MSIKEKIGSLYYQQLGRTISEGVKETLKNSQLDDILDELLLVSGVKLSREILENGNKVLIIIHWPSMVNESLNQIILSVRAERIAVIGGPDRNHDFVAIEGPDRFDREKIEEVIAHKFLNPTKVSLVTRFIPDDK